MPRSKCVVCCRASFELACKEPCRDACMSMGAAPAGRRRPLTSDLCLSTVVYVLGPWSCCLCAAQVSEELSALDVRGLDRCAELLLYCGGDTNAFPILGVSPAEPDSDDDFPFFDSERHTHPKAPVNPLNQPAAIAQALSLLRPLLPPTTKLKLRHAVMSDALAAELTYQATQGWIHMSLDQLIWPAPADVTVTLPRLDTLQVFTPMVTRTNDEGTRVTQSGPLTDAMITTLMRCVGLLRRVYRPVRAMYIGPVLSA